MKGLPWKVIDAAAAVIANARGGRHGAPPIKNVLDILPAKLRAEVDEDARAALEAAGVPELLASLKELTDTLHDCVTTSECAVLIARGDAISCARLRRAREALARAEDRQ